ncbi:hypothetical protein HK405_015266, partial [Cladochytrium tenue]
MPSLAPPPDLLHPAASLLQSSPVIHLSARLLLVPSTLPVSVSTHLRQRCVRRAYSFHTASAVRTDAFPLAFSLRSDLPCTPPSADGLFRSARTATARWLKSSLQYEPPRLSRRAFASAAGRQLKKDPLTSAWFDRSTQISLLEALSKELPRSRKTLEFLTGASAIPKNPRVKAPEADVSYLSVQVGEDAYFRRHDSMGVADGVGGWGEVKGAKAALFSRKVMHYASVQLEAFDDITNVDYDIKDYYGIQPKGVLQQAYDATMEDATNEGFLGSTTAMLCILRDDELRVCTLGDCTLMVIRDGEPIFRTEEQQHSFNFPFQL